MMPDELIKIDTREIFDLSTKLMDLHRAALPNAVRFTLSDLAFDVKKNTLYPALNESGMIIRNPTFFKKYSGVQKAVGWDISKMYSEAGMIPEGNAAKAVSRLKEQDEGGKLGNRNYVPDDQARIGGNRSGKVRKNNMHQRLILCGHVQWGDKQGLIRTVTRSGVEKQGRGLGFVVIYGWNLYEIIGYHRVSKQHRKDDVIKLHLRKLYSYKKDRQIEVKPHHFIEKASLLSGKKLDEIFKENAERQLAKFAGRK